MTKNSDKTKKKLLKAATVEFAERGIAGARIDRIATLAGCNKALIYSYFGNKDELFDIVFDDLVARVVQETPMDPNNIPEYAGALFDSYQKHPEILRLAFWDRLERDWRGILLPHVAEVTMRNIGIIEEALKTRYLNSAYTAAEIMSLVTTLPSLWGLRAKGEAPHTAEELARQRFVVTDAMAKLLGPPTS